MSDRLISPPAPATAGKRADSHAGTSINASTQRDPGHHQPHPKTLTDTERETIHAAVIAEVMIAARERRRHTRQASRAPPLPSEQARTCADARPHAADTSHKTIAQRDGSAIYVSTRALR
jgi:hypothetical protein